MVSRSRAARREPPTAPLCLLNTWGGLVPRRFAIDGRPVGSLRRRAPVQGPAGIVGTPVRFDELEVGVEAGVVRRCRLGLATAPGVRARRRRERARRAGIRAWGCRAIGAGRLVAVVHGWRGRGNRRGDRDAARTSGREPHGAGLGGPLHQSEAARPLPGSLLAGGREGRPARCTGSGLGVADRPSLPAAPGVDRPDDHRIARVVAPQRGHVRLVVERLVLVNQQKHPRRPSQPTRRSCCRCLASARAFSPPCSPRPATCCSDETMPRCAVSAGWRRLPAVRAGAWS